MESMEGVGFGLNRRRNKGEPETTATEHPSPRVVLNPVTISASMMVEVIVTISASMMVELILHVAHCHLPGILICLNLATSASVANLRKQTYEPEIEVKIPRRIHPDLAITELNGKDHLCTSRSNVQELKRKIMIIIPIYIAI
ncbi:hypothetical protein VNO77_15695 [Canavalia gladiata]|uniref:Uncharacterized protein n=1 Tax=Canavalia gladiata TaxID=3824 RepID=A0AAN9LZR2_CANGL